MSGFKRQVLTQLKKQMRDLRQRLPSAQAVALDWQGSTTSAASTRFFQDPILDKSLPDGQLIEGAVHEFVPARYGDFPAALGFTLCCLQRFQTMEPRAVLWCSFGGRSDFPNAPFPHGLLSLGVDPAIFFQVQVTSEKEFLWVMEEGLSSKARPLVIGSYMGAERLYDFTASRRLALRASRHGGTLLLVRNYRANEAEGQVQSTAAATRWSIGALPSSPAFFNNARLPAMGYPRWQVALTRCKGGHENMWQLEWQYETHSFRLVPEMVHRTSVEATIYNSTGLSA